MPGIPRTLGGTDLLASFYTLSGAPNGLPARHTFADRVAAAAAAGYAAIGMAGFDIAATKAAECRTEHDLAQIAADSGVRVAEVETLNCAARLNDDHRAAAQTLFTSAANLQARHVNLVFGGSSETSLDVDGAAEAFAELADLAADHGLLLALEFMPFMTVRTIDVACEIVERAGRDNGGLVVDTYHFFRGGSLLDDLARVPGKRITTLQLSDVPTAAPADLLIETRTARLLPGQGELPLTDFLRTVDATGADAPIGVEILSDALRAAPIGEAAASTAEATRAALALART